MQKRSLLCNGTERPSGLKELHLLLDELLRSEKYRILRHKFIAFKRERVVLVRELKRIGKTNIILDPLPEELKIYHDYYWEMLAITKAKFAHADKRFYYHKHYPWCIDPYTMEYKISKIGWYDFGLAKSIMEIRYGRTQPQIHFISGKEAIRRDFKLSGSLLINDRWVPQRGKFPNPSGKHSLGGSFTYLKEVDQIIATSYRKHINPYKLYERYIERTYKYDILKKRNSFPEDPPKKNIIIPNLW